MILGLIALLGYTSFGLFWMLVTLAIVSGLLMIITTLRRCCGKCAEGSEQAGKAN